MAEKKITFNEAVSELETILDTIESGEIDIDDLSIKVKRASELIKLCKGRLRSTEEEIEKIVKGME